uniref:Uncharacterized protein n=1 Tax=Amphimedon queenslandica TaxID=400682 RepID=A0A1X7TIL1_AMPQE
PGGCGLNIFFLCSIFILSVMVSIIAVLPPVQNAQPTSGFLQALIVSLYTAYLTYSALYYKPYGQLTIPYSGYIPFNNWLKYRGYGLAAMPDYR